MVLLSLKLPGICVFLILSFAVSLPIQQVPPFSFISSKQVMNAALSLAPILEHPGSHLLHGHLPHIPRVILLKCSSGHTALLGCPVAYRIKSKPSAWCAMQHDVHHNTLAPHRRTTHVLSMIPTSQAPGSKDCVLIHYVPVSGMKVFVEWINHRCIAVSYTHLRAHET